MDWTSGASDEAQFDLAAIGTRVRAARERLGLNQGVVAGEARMSQPTYSRLEKGTASPKVLTGELLSALSRVLGRPMTYFLMGSPVRDRVRLAARGDDGGDVAPRAERILELLEIDDDLDDLQLTGERPAPEERPWRIFAEQAQSDTRRPAKAQGTELAELLREELALDAGPLEDLSEVVEGRLGIDLAVLSLGSGLSAVAAFDDVRQVALAGVSVAEPYARQRFSLAHEVAHVLFGDEHSDVVQRSPVEQRADKFAQALLVPPAGIRAWLERRGLSQDERLDYPLACQLAEDFGISPTTAWIALSDLHLAPAASASSARMAAIETGHLTEHPQREKAARVERIPRRIEARVLAALRSGHLNPESAAAALGQDPAALRPDDGSANRHASGTPALR